MYYAYVRVSTKNQNEDRQLLALSGYSIPEHNIFIEKASGKDFERPIYRKLIRCVRENDVIIIKSIDRLGRNYREIIDEWRTITQKKKADIIVLDMPLLNTTNNKDLLGTLISDLVLTLLSYVAENERNLIKQRQSEGIAAAKLRGIKFGRPSLPLPDNFIDICIMYQNNLITSKEAAVMCGFSTSTFLRNYNSHFKK